MADADDDLSGDEFSEAERVKVRAMLRRDERAKWAARMLKTYLQYAAVVIVSAGVIWGAFKETIKGFAP